MTDPSTQESSSENRERSSHLEDVLSRSFVFVSGKGGVGKTTLSQAIAKNTALKGFKTLWVTIEDPLREPGEVHEVEPNLFYFNCDSQVAFEEYLKLKIHVPGLASLFVNNRMIQFMGQAAPGVKDIVLLGKIWHSIRQFPRIVVDMPSTGYGLAMFQSTRNFTQMFKGGPIQKDADRMLETFEDKSQTGHLIVALPEEMPLRESIELNHNLLKIFPDNPAAFIVNRSFPKANLPAPSSHTPLADSVTDYIARRNKLEELNLEIWKTADIAFRKIDFVPNSGNHAALVDKIARKLREAGERR